MVPARWEIGRRDGDASQGSFRIDNERRVVIQVRWWRAARPIPFGRIVERHARTARSPQGASLRFRETRAFTLATGPDDRTAVFTSAAEGGMPVDDGECLVLWQRVTAGRCLLVRLLIENGQPDADCVRLLFAGLRLQDVDEARDWALHDLALRTPVGYRLREAAVRAGVIYLEFHRGRQQLALRRFSAADAVMGTAAPDMEALERWTRRVYAEAFHDMRYQVARGQDDQGRPWLRLTGKRRLLAPIEMKWLLPKHRRVPRRIDVIWNPTANKLYCLEIRRETAALAPDLAAFSESLRMNLPAKEESLAPDAPLTGSGAARQLALRARVRRHALAQARRDVRGRLVLAYTVERPRRLRVMRLLGGLAAGPTRAEKIVELDLMGEFVWEACAGEPRVLDLIDTVRRRFQISYREAELSVSEFVRALGSRGLLSTVVEDRA